LGSAQPALAVPREGNRHHFILRIVRSWGWKHYYMRTKLQKMAKNNLVYEMYIL
jgi:hypothetical protein